MARFITKLCFLLASILSASNGFIVSCEYGFGDQSFGSYLSKVYFCSAKITADGNPDITTVTGNLDRGKTLSDVQYFTLGEGGIISPITKIPSNFGTFFSGLVGICWFNSRLEKISAEDLRPFPNLVYANFYSNLIRRIEADMFKYNPLIVVFEFSGNVIDFIDKDFLNNTPLLQAAGVYNNRCIGMTQAVGGLINQYYTFEHLKSDIEHMCGPLKYPGISDACSASCVSRFDKIEAKVSSVESCLTAAWYEKLKWFFKTAFGL